MTTYNTLIIAVARLLLFQHSSVAVIPTISTQHSDSMIPCVAGCVITSQKASNSIRLMFGSCLLLLLRNNV